MRGLVIGNDDDLEPALVGERLAHHGITLTPARREATGDWPDPAGFDMVLTLGSVWNVYDPAVATPVAAEAAFTRAVLGARVPLFAICFGAQVLAHALGADVRRAPTPEIGWFDVEPTPAGADLVGPGRPLASGPWMEWHYDVFDVPAGFTELARTTAGPQVIVGDRVLATQFHPEVTTAVVEGWLAKGGAAEHRQHGGEPADLLAETAAAVARARPHTDALVDWFLTSIAG